MTAAQAITGVFGGWLDDAASGLMAVAGRLAAGRTVRLVEDEDGTLAVHAAQQPGAGERARIVPAESASTLQIPASLQALLRGSHVQLELGAGRFMFRPLEVPARAAEFLDGIVRAQIDRLTPWSAEQAAFGASAPTDIGDGRVVVTVAATATAVLLPFAKALAAAGARSITIVARPPEGDCIPVWRQDLSGLDARRVRRVLLGLLLAAGVTAAGAAGAAAYFGSELQARQDALAQRIAQRRAAMLAARNAPADPKTVAEDELARRKTERPSSVIVLDILSQILPDHTYVTELRIEGDKLRINGFTRDAPALIRLMEQSRHFARATFFAPTTRAASDPGDRFNIEAQMLPVFSTSP
ncbi:MAG: PilN domain-containing protein [Variibacter sp.]|nr:PilN domain-containing protein [Variibacter sp.]